MHTLLLQGWQYSNDPNLKPYQVRHNELTVCDGCVMWGSRVVVPQTGRKSVMEQLHDGHPGTSRMKSLARSFVWWPQMDDDIADRVKSCNQCQLTRHAPQPAPLHPWEWPDRPWTRLHIDYAQPYLEKWFLIVVDAHSKWLEVKIVKSATTANTIDHYATVPDVIDDFIPFQSPTTTTTAQQANSELPTPLRRSTRVRTAPDRLTYPPK